MLKGAESIELSDSEQEISYYEEAIKFLDRYKNNKKFDLAKSKAYFYSSRIKEGKTWFSEAIQDAR